MAWQDSINNTALAKAITAGLQQYGQNRQQGIPIGQGYQSGAGSAASVLNAMKMGKVNAMESPVPTQMSVDTSIQGSSETNPAYAGYQAPASSYSNPTPTVSTPKGDTRIQELEKMNRNPVQENEYQRLLDELRNQANQGPSEEELNALYNPAMEYLNQAESTLRGQLPTTLDLLGQQAQTSQGLLGNQRASAQSQLGEQQTQATQRKEDAISAARRLFSELQMANQQRFGGASSAGLAASELQGRELMRNRSTIGQDYNTAARQIEASKLDVENQYQSGLQQIEDRKQQAINEVNADFQSKLLEINSQRASTQQAKAAARLELLQQARDRVFQINLQDFNFKQQLAAQKQAADAQISQYSSALQNQVGTAQSATSGFLNKQPGNAKTEYALGTGTQTMESPIYRGQIGKDDELMRAQGMINSIRGYDDYNNTVYPVVGASQKIARDLSEGTYNPNRIY